MSANRKRQRGNILLPVSLIGLSTTLMLSGLMNHSIVVEQSAVENRLAEIRAYWMTMGHFRYALSRTRHSNLCPNPILPCLANQNITDVSKANTLQSYLNEISSLRTFTYPEENSGYSIKINLTAAPDDNPTRQNFSGHLMMTSSYPTVGVSSLPVLSGMALRFTPYQLRFCAGLTVASPTCGPISQNNGGQATDRYSVKRFFRLNSVS